MAFWRARYYVIPEQIKCNSSGVRLTCGRWSVKLRLNCILSTGTYPNCLDWSPFVDLSFQQACERSRRELRWHKSKYLLYLQPEEQGKELTMPAWLQATSPSPAMGHSERMLLTLSTSGSGVLRAAVWRGMWDVGWFSSHVLYQVV